MTNIEIANLFQNIAAAYTIKDENKYRFQIIAYERAADEIAKASSEVKDLVNEDKLESLPGIGSSIKQHIEELVKTGKVKHFQDVLKDIPEAVFPLLQIPTFGPKKSYKLVKAFRLKNPKSVVDDIDKLAKDGKIASLESFGEKSQSDIIRAIQEYKKGEGKTRRMELPLAGEIAEKMLTYLNECKAVIKAVPLGSLRRMVSTIGDIDIAVQTKTPNEVIDHFVAYPYKERIIEKGPTTASLLTSGGKQVDLMTMPKDSFGALLQHFTGSKNHNIHLREYALSKGISLSERGMKVKTEKTKITLKKFATEEEFYQKLGMDWISPELREDSGEIEAAIEHKLPKLIKLSDIKGDLHIHSNYPIEPSHDLGQNTMEDMIKKALQLGYKYIGFSEHNPSVSQHSKEQIYSILARRNEKIEQLNESNKNIRIINLLEVDILASGRLALDDKSLSYIDAALVSIHSSFGMDKHTMTKRVLQGFSHPKAKILSHPTGRLINERPGYELDFDAVFDHAIAYKKTLEINAWPTRLDLPDALVKEAVRHKVKMIIDTDSHATWQMDLIKYGVAVARRGWAEKSDILNTMPYNQFIEWLKNEGR